MRQFHHHPLETRSRYVRLVLAEKQLPFEAKEEPFWLRRPEFLALSPAGDLPVLVEDAEDMFASQPVLTDAAALGEYLEETNGAPALLGTAPKTRAEVRRLVNWFLLRFHAEVAGPLLTERLWKRLAATGEPDTNILRAAAANLRHHLNYIQYLVERRAWLAGEQLSLADLAAAAALSSLDYLGAVPWETAPEAKEWYAKLKSRPAFRALLSDHLPGLPPVPHYTNLDF